MWPEGVGTMPWLTMWRGSSLDLEVSWPSAVVHSIVSRYLVSCMVSQLILVISFFEGVGNVFAIMIGHNV